MLVFTKIAIASDHGGFLLKQKIKEKLDETKIEVLDLGTNSPDVSVDYPDYAKKVCETVITDHATCGILICRTGVGISIAANRFKGIRALLCSGNPQIVRLSREHNNCNVICFGADFINFENSWESLQKFISTEFQKGRHQQRLNKLS